MKVAAENTTALCVLFLIVGLASGFTAGVYLAKANKKSGSHVTEQATRAPRPTLAPAPAPLQFSWRRNENSPSWSVEWELCGSDEIVYASVYKSQFDSSWSVFHNGAAFGEFTSREAAMREAEKVARRLGRETY